MWTHEIIIKFIKTGHSLLVTKEIKQIVIRRLNKIRIPFAFTNNTIWSIVGILSQRPKNCHNNSRPPLNGNPSIWSNNRKNKCAIIIFVFNSTGLNKQVKEVKQNVLSPKRSCTQCPCRISIFSFRLQLFYFLVGLCYFISFNSINGFTRKTLHGFNSIRVFFSGGKIVIYVSCVHRKNKNHIIYMTTIHNRPR